MDEKQIDLMTREQLIKELTAYRHHETLSDSVERIARIGHYVWNYDSNQLVSCSVEYAHIFGMSVEEIMLRENSMEGAMQQIHPDDSNHYRKTWETLIDTGSLNIEFRIIRTDGEIRHLREIGVRVADNNSQDNMGHGLIQDITEQKLVEYEIIKAKIAAEAANQAKSLFLSSMSHELRTPLNAILGYSQLLKLNVLEPMTDRQQRAVEHVTKAGQHLHNLIKQVLSFSQIQSGESQLSIEPLNLSHMVKACISSMVHTVEPLHINIIDKVSDKDLPMLLADLHLLKQSLSNILDNAVKYNTYGGTVTIDAEIISSHRIRINVSDTGLGIDDQFHGQVFEAFNRLGRESLSIEGVGLGLSISRQLIEMMGGYINFTSKLDSGSTFWIELPLDVTR
ncbi:MAG: HAMP domain-containing histidine kinase [Gammaproteobacteria bacterium]|nr:HAMP domain-containing histidine kinase [Gammaproteobacteria bacterium]